MNQQENPLHAYQDLPPGERKRAGVYFDAAAALACLLCAGLTFYLAGFDQPAETAVFFAAAGTVVVGLHHAVSEPTIHRRRYAGTAAVVAIFAAVLSGGSLLGGTPSTDRFTMVLLAYLWPVLLACWLVLLARRLRAWLRGEEEFIFWGDLFSTSGETATELGAQLSPKARSAVNLVLAALFTAGCVAGTINAAGHAAERLQPPPEETVTRQYAALCLERDEGIAPEQLESAALTLVPEEEWEGGLQDLYAYTFTWQADGGQESRCYGVVLYSDFTCELVGRGDSLDACIADAERYWMQL